MKVLQINVVCGRGSTGRIATDLADALMAEGHECRIAYGRDTVPEKYQSIAVRIGTDWDIRFHGILTRLFDLHGFGSKRATKQFLKWAEEYDPDVLHLHNLHGYYINIAMLFDWIKSRPHMQVKWTLHDCWAFTGHCAHYSAIECYRWKTGCTDQCPQKMSYPQCAFLGRASKNYQDKKRMFLGIPDMTVITPSEWLANQVKESFLQCYPVEVIPNGIDLSVFHNSRSDFRKKMGLEGKKIILGVASVWSEHKGLKDFVALSNLLDESTTIVLVGLTDKQIDALPANIIGIPKTNNIQELVEIYSAADVFVNPSVEETMGLTTVEAMACGTPVITYDKTAVPEVVGDRCGFVVSCGVQNIVDALAKVEIIFSKEACAANVLLYDKQAQYKKYMALYAAF